MSKRKEVGRDQLGSERDNYNNRKSRRKYTGSSKGVKWKNKRRHEGF